MNGMVGHKAGALLCPQQEAAPSNLTANISTVKRC
jgi:hypothetical protein